MVYLIRVFFKIRTSKYEQDADGKNRDREFIDQDFRMGEDQVERNRN